MSTHSAPGTSCGRLLAFAFATSAMLSAVEATAAEELRIGGTGNALGSMRLVGEGFMKLNPDVRVTVLPSIGTSGAIKAVPKGALDIGLSARPLKEDERKLGMTSVEYARTLLVFAVGRTTHVSSLTLDQLADIYTGKLANWPDGSQIRPVLRQADEDSTQQVKRMSVALEKALTAAVQRPGVPFATTDQEMADKTETLPGALGVMTLSLIQSENRPLRALTLDGVEPTLANSTSGRYPHVRQFFLITRADRPATVQRFVAFLQSPAGRDIMIRAGNWIP